MKRNLIFFLVLIFVVNIHAQTLIKIPDTLFCPLNEIYLPVYAENFSDVGAITLFISYDTILSEFISIENTNPQLDNLLFHDQDGEIGAAWHSKDGITVMNGRLFDLRLKYLGGDAVFAFSNECEVAGTALNILPVEFQHGTIHPSDSISQVFTFGQGWNSFSLYIEPYTTDPETIFAPILADIEIITDGIDFFYPPGNMNTLGAIHSAKGYTIKTNSAATLTVSGCTASEKMIQVPQGWSYLAVPVRCEVSVADLAATYPSEIRIIRSLIGTEMHWPENDVFTLDTLMPGKAYLIFSWSAFDLVFPMCAE